ncbi:MAG: Zn-ribbon domain-containing OB-fold protein [Chloroflexi bacterium]|nr:Zn-ribbon domain-containing OB-fold protein [Chloroflexota bacterium]
MANAPVPVPAADQESAPFWEGCNRGELLYQRCGACGKARFYPRPACPNCASESFTWEKASGKATLYSWTIIYPPTLPAFKDKVPYPVILVELAEGVRMISNIVDCKNEDLRIGMPLEVTFEKVSDGVTLHRFRPASR